MPLYSEHISSMYYGGSPSYSAPYSYSSSVLPTYSASSSYLNSGGSYSNHSSLGGYSRPLHTSRWVPSSARNYSPLLSTISERGTSSPSRLMSPRRIQLSKRTYPTSSYTPRPIHINTADIDVSRDRYRQKAPSPPPAPVQRSPSPEKDNGPYMPRVDGKPETGIDSSPGIQRSTIKRGRTVVRLHTVKRKERDSPRKPQTDYSESQQQETADDYENCIDNIAEDITKNEPTEPVRWREKLSDDLTYKDKREKKTLGAKLIEKFIVKDRDSDSEGSIKQKSRKLDVAPSLQETPSTISSSSRSPDRRCSIEMLAEQANLLDSLIRRENLSTASLDLSKVGLSEEGKSNVEPTQSIKRKKSIDKDNPLKTTKSDQSLHESLKSFKDPKQFSKMRSLKKSSSAGGNICRLDSITEVPKDSKLVNLPPIEESRLSIKRESIKSKPKPKLRAKITSSVEVPEPKSPLKFRVENVIVEETPRAPKKEIIYSAVVDEILPQVPKSESTPKDESATKTPRKQIQYDTKKRTKTLVRKDDLPESPEPDDGNFWDKIGKRETVYLMKRKQFIENNREQHRRAVFWFPEDEESAANDESGSINTENLSAGSTKLENNNVIDISHTTQSADSSKISLSTDKTDEQSPISEKKQEKETIVANRPKSNELSEIKKPAVSETEETITPATSNEIITTAKAKESYAQEKSTSEEKVNDSNEIINDGKKTENIIPVQKNIVEIKKKSLTPDKMLVLEQKLFERMESVENINELKETKKDISEIKKKSPTLDKTLTPEQELVGKLKPVNRIYEQKELKKKNSIETKKKSPTPDKILVSEQKLVERVMSAESSDGLKDSKKCDSEKCRKGSDKTMNKTQIASDNSSNKENVILINNVAKKLSERESSVLEQQGKDSDTTKTKSTDKLQENFDDELKGTEKNIFNKETDNKLSGKDINVTQKDERCKVAETANTKKVLEIPKEIKALIQPSEEYKIQLKAEIGTLSVENILKIDNKAESFEISQNTGPEIRLAGRVAEKNDTDKIELRNNEKLTNITAVVPPKGKPAQVKVVEPPSVASSSKDDTKTSSQKTPNKNSSKTHLESVEKDDTLKIQKDLPVNNNVTSINKDVASSNVPATVVESENIPNVSTDIKNLTLEEQRLGEGKKAENITSKQEKQEDVKELSVKDVTKPVTPRKPVKEEAAARPLIATPRPLQKKIPQIVHSSSSSETSSEEDTSEDDDADESDTSEGSTEFFECENNPDGRTSTGSNDSGFDSSAPNSPAGFLQIKKGGESAGTSGTAPAHADATGISEQELEQSTAYGIFRKTGRFTPPARSIPRFRKYTIEDFHFIKVLGKGSFGKVLLAELRDTEYYYAVKCLKKDVVLEDDDVECTLIERKVLALGTNHPYLCHLFATFQTDSHLFFVMEYLNGGDLMFHIQQSGRFPEARARFYAAEIVSGLKFLHKRGIVYRDLKLDNILLDFDGHVRIADFGMCKLQIYLEKTADTFCGTPDYMAPEIIKGLKYNQTVDWWSFGVLLYEMLIGQSPFSGCDEDELFWSICNEMPSYPRFLSQDALVILTRLLDKDARTRLGGVECMHGDVRDQNFFHPIHWDKLERKELETPFKPRVRHPLDTQYFDRAFTGERPRLTAVEPAVLRSMDQEPFRGFSYTNPNATDR